MALDWLPIEIEPAPADPSARGEVVTPFTAATIPVPDVLAGLTFTPVETRPVRRVLTAARSEITTPFDTIVFAKLGWLPVDRRRPAPPKRARPMESAAPLSTQVVIAQGLTWLPGPPHPTPPPFRPYAQSDTTEVIVPNLINTAVALGCLEIVDTGFTVTSFLTENVALTDLTGEALTHTDLIAEALC